MELENARKKAIFLGFGTGFAFGLALAAMVAGLAAWGAVLKRQKDLAAAWSPAMAVVVKTPIQAGEAIRAKDLESRAVPGGMVSPNAVLPTEADSELAGTRAKVDLYPGDLLLRSAVGLQPRGSETGK
jgi:Flp pilus assembly protein CpaB